MMSTSLDLGDGRTIRTIEHMMAALRAFAIDNVLIDVEGSEVPIFDGSCAVWCREIIGAGLSRLPAPRRAIRVRKTVQISLGNGFPRIEPGEGFHLDVTHDVLPQWPVMRWTGHVSQDRFVAEIAPSRSFGVLDLQTIPGWRRPSRHPPSHPPVVPNRREAASQRRSPSRHETEQPPDLWGEVRSRRAMLPGDAPVLRGARLGRAMVAVGRHVIGRRRFSDEPVRHVALDVIGDLALAGAPLLGRITAHNPTHARNYVLVVALMRNRDAWMPAILE